MKGMYRFPNVKAPRETNLAAVLGDLPTWQVQMIAMTAYHVTTTSADPIVRDVARRLNLLLAMDDGHRSRRKVERLVSGALVRADLEIVEITED
jgi:hypothetical protein